MLTIEEADVSFAESRSNKSTRSSKGCLTRSIGTGHGGRFRRTDKLSPRDSLCDYKTIQLSRAIYKKYFVKDINVPH